MSTTPVWLYDVSAGAPIEATLHNPLALAQILAAEMSWEPLRSAVADEIEHGHWDWRLKTGTLTGAGVACCGVEKDGEMQGMMIVRECGFYARLAPEIGRPLVYIDFLETAPWNLRLSFQQPRYKGIGLALVWHAVQVSVACGYRGRLGLKSLPRAEEFYEQACGMVAIPATRYNDLAYYEFTADAADAFLRRIEQ